MRRKRLVLILVATIATGALIGYFINSLFFVVRDVSIEDVVSDPQSFDRARVRLRGYVVDTHIYVLGPKYVLMSDYGTEIALGGKSGPENIDLDPYVSFIFDGKNYTQIRSLKLIVLGSVRYIGSATDTPPYYFEVETVKEANTVMEDVATEISKKAGLVREGLAKHRYFAVRANFYNYSWVKRMKEGHAREVYENVPEGHDIWEVVWTFGYNEKPGGYTVIVIVDSETGAITQEMKGIEFE